MPDPKKKLLICAFLFISSLFVFTRGLEMHGLEYRDDEIFYYKSTQEMKSSGNYLSPTYFGENRFQKPILFYWLVLISYKIFGVNWFAARIVSSIFASLTVCLTWLIAKELFDKRVAILSVTILMTMALFFRHAKNVVPDMSLNFFIVLAMFSWLKFSGRNGDKYIDGKKNTGPILWEILFFVSCSLGFMTKGFAAVIVPILAVSLCIFFIKDFLYYRKMNFLKGLLIFLLIASPWFIYMIKIHGVDYIKYMLWNETAGRIIDHNQKNSLLKMAINFADHFYFYLKTMFSYFAPWSLFFIFALPLSICNVLSENIQAKEKNALKIMLVWLFVVWGFFSLMYFAINHYLLILTTPFAIIISYFFMKELPAEKYYLRVIDFFRKYIVVFIFPACVFAFIILEAHMTGRSSLLLSVYFFIFLIVWINMIRSRGRMVAPLTLSLFLIFVFSQSPLMYKAGLASHAVLQKFAKTINDDNISDAKIGVGSHDIHEKEFQAYFDTKVEKLGVSWESGTRQNLSNFFSSNPNAYCLMLEKDYKELYDDLHLGKYDVEQEEYILRRRMHLDKGFLIALLKADKKKVKEYLMEKLILMKKEDAI